MSYLQSPVKRKGVWSINLKNAINAYFTLTQSNSSVDVRMQVHISKGVFLVGNNHNNRCAPELVWTPPPGIQPR